MAVTAARAAHCARDQGGDEAYFLMHDALFANQERWAAAEEPPASPVTTTATLPAASPVFGEIAAEVGLDGESLAACVSAGSHEDTIMESFNEAVTDLGLNGTPTFVINGQVIAGVMTSELMADSIGKAERGERITLVLPKEYADQLVTPTP
jgi:protein-disulfide isomerase